MAPAFSPGGYAPGYSTARIKLQRERRAATHAAFLLGFLRHDSHVLDCGCGPGSITNDFGLLCPDAVVIGIDIEPGQCRVAREDGRTRNIHNVFYEQQDVLDLEFSDNTFDVVFAHALLDHLREPAAAIAEMLRVLKPGGLIGLRSGDWSELELTPRCAAAEDCVSKYVTLVRASGGSLEVGGQLGPLLEVAGAEDIRLTTSRETLREPVLVAEALSSALRKAGGSATPALTRDDGCGALLRWAQMPGAQWIDCWNEALAIKPAA